MKYVSTRGQGRQGDQAPVMGFQEVVLAGLAEDGGLYLPETWPQMDIDKLRGLSYTDLAFEVMKPFIGDEIEETDLKKIISKSYAVFDHPDIAPTKKLYKNQYLLELFHGPTLAFKDYPLQFLGNLFEHILEQQDRHITVLGATSGDTGSAAIAGCRGQDRIRIFILHPEGRISDVQRRQMTTAADNNVINLAVKGTFDDCQALVKDLFNDLGFRHQVNLSAINSINWARIMAQIVYYFYAALKFENPVTFVVPTGNFGNIFAAYAAHRMGLPLRKLVAATNKNDILFRYFESGTMATSAVEPSLSPSMDIQISSNFERLLFEMTNRNATGTASQMELFKTTGTFHFPTDSLQGLFTAHRLDDAGILDCIKKVHVDTGMLIDPHTATGVAAAYSLCHPELVSGSHENPDQDRLDDQMREDQGIVISLACAHPAKFPDAVEQATGQRPALPDHLADLFDRTEKYDVIENDLKALKKIILS